jgi:apolipoprotein D and lipocalin family protein
MMSQNMGYLRNFPLSWLILSLIGCAPAAKIPVVTGFESARYLGVWYEVARLPNSFEEGLSNITAEYSKTDNGRLKVLNRGYDEKSGQWRSAQGSAYFTQNRNIGALRVTFFWPFYGSYRVIALDRNSYSYSLVMSGDLNYLWILSRTPTLENSTLAALLAFAEQNGFDTKRLIYVVHDRATTG